MSTVNNITLTSSDLLTLATDFGCEVQEQKSFFKITSPSKNRKAVYIAKSKKTITRVDFSGFELEGSAVIKEISKEDAKALRMGAVRAQIVTKGLPVDMTDGDILDAVEYGLAQLMSDEEGFKLGKKAPQEEGEEGAVSVEEAAEEAVANTEE